MTDDGISFDTKTVQAVRGFEARTISKWEGEGWEFVSQSQGKLRTEILIRRPKPTWRKPLYAIGGTVAAAVLVAAIGIGVLSERNETDGSTEPAAAGTSSADTSSEKTSSEEESAVLTPENSAELASLLDLTDYCDGSIEKFSKKHHGQVIAFDGNIGAMNSHDGAKTRYDILIGAGRHSETSSPGPSFQFRDVNTTSDLHYQGEVPETIGVGTNLHVKAEVGEYEPSSCLFLIEPVETTMRKAH